MTRYVAMLRAVNVGGARISMAQLREIGLAAGFTEVSTHLNSGNLLFGVPVDAGVPVAEMISSAIEQLLGRPVPVMIRTPGQLQAALDTALEYFGDKDERRVAVLFLDRSVAPPPPGEPDQRLGRWPSEEYRIAGEQVYLHYPNGQAETKLTTPFIEAKLGVVGTARGIKTVAGLIAKS